MRPSPSNGDGPAGARDPLPARPGAESPLLPGADECPVQQGHRARLLQRFRAAGIASLHDHEIVELILTYALPRRDTKPAAKNLLRRFGTVSAVINASTEELEQTAGIGPRAAALFGLCRELLAYCLQERFRQGDLLTHRGDVEAYLRFHFGLRHYEFVAALFLDGGHRIITSEIMAEGTSGQCAVYPRKIFERALHHKAASMILAHNHPGGSAQPSEADWQITRRIVQAGKLLEIPLVDHILICKDTVLSLRESSKWPQ